ncbi:MAG: arylsulfatase [Verrucomicrobiales bacterium]|nr:arylsulfatase [Verrucomicrobiales bacterium]
MRARILLAFLSAILVASADDRPNIIFIMADDQGYADLGCYGSPHIKTPNIDKLATEGTRFTDCYSGSAVCAPTRCVVMTGLHPGHCRRRDNTATGNLESFGKNRPLVFLEPEDLTVAESLKSAGYHTAGFGKWGIGNVGSDGVPEKQGFDLWFGYYDQVHAHTYYTDHLVRNSENVPLDGKTYSHTVIMEEADTWIRKVANAKERGRRKPFFAYYAITPPHGKYVVPDQGIYRDKPWTDTEKNYAAMCTLIDSDVGRLMATLDELGIDDNTIVFYTSDNGPNKPFLKTFKSNHPFRGTKRQLTEGGLRCPMVARWPGKIPAGKTSPYIWGHVDLFATACTLAETPIPPSLDSHNILPTLLGQESPPRPPMYWEIHHPFQQAVRLENWKAFRTGTAMPLQLYNLDTDTAESKNLAEQNPDLVARIETIMATDRTDSPFYPTLPKPKKKRKR